MGGYLEKAYIRTQGKKRIQKQKIRQQFLIKHGHSRGPRRRDMWRLLEGLADLTPRQNLIHAGE